MTIEAYGYCPDKSMRRPTSPDGGRSSSRMALVAILGLSLLGWAPVVIPLVAFLER